MSPAQDGINTECDLNVPPDSSRVSIKHLEDYRIPNFMRKDKSEKKKSPPIRKKKGLSARLRWFLSFGNQCESRCLMDSDAANVQLV